MTHHFFHEDIVALMKQEADMAKTTQKNQKLPKKYVDKHLKRSSKTNYSLKKQKLIFL